MTRLLAIASLLLFACGGSEPSKQVAAPGQGTGTGLCQILHKGGKIHVEDDPAGSRMIVQMPEKERKWSRDYVRSMAARHEDRRTDGGGYAHREALPPHATSHENTKTGLRVLYRPVNVAQMDAIRSGLRKHVADLPARCGTKK